MKASVVLVALLLGPLGASAWAQGVKGIFVPDRRDELCAPTKDPRVVSPTRLAQAMIEEAQVPISLIDRANPSGIADGNVTPDELFTAMIKGINNEKFFGKFTEFGSRARDADTRLLHVTEALQSFLREGGSLKQGYVPYKGGTPLPKNPNDAPRIEEVFSASPVIEIRCEARAGEMPPAAVEATGFDDVVGRLVGEVRKRLRVRAKLDDLRIDNPDDIKDLDSAEISFNHDDKASQDTFKIKGVIGWDLGKFAGWNTLPYVKYERTDISPDNPDERDVNVLSPGLLANRQLTLGDRGTADIGVSAEATLDFAQRSRLFKLHVFAEPSFTLDVGGRPLQLFGERLRFGRLGVRPNIKPMLDLVQVIERGSNPALVDARTYVGVGADLELKLRLLDTPVLENILLTARYWHLQLFGAHLANAHRLSTSLAYEITPGISLKFSYEDGNNRDTFQEERYYNIALGLKY